MRVTQLVRAAIIAALYVAISYMLMPFSYGPVQVRVSEALTLLPVLCAEAVPGVAVGCLLANLFSPSLHILDVVVGSLATLVSALATYRLRNICFKGLPLLSALPPIIINAFAVGITLSYLYLPQGSAPAAWVLNILSVGAGQVISCGVLGLLLVYVIKKNSSLMRLFTTKGKKA